MGVMQKAQLQEQVLARAVMCLALTGSTPTTLGHGNNINDKQNAFQLMLTVSGHGDHV